MKPIEAIKRAGRTYQAGESAKICGVATRTVSSWCEKGLLLSETEGRGDRRQFTAMQVVEMAVIAKLSDAGMSSKRISKTMNFLRRDSGANLKYCLSHDNSFLFTPVEQAGPITTAADRGTVCWNEGTEVTNDPQELLRNLFHQDTDRTLILNIGRIAERVVAAL